MLISEVKNAVNETAMFGRRTIYTDTDVITEKNVIDILNKALRVHEANSAEIDYLYNYYKGRQPILGRKKDVRPEINNKIVENRANEIVSFKVGYLTGEPVQYISRGNNEDATGGLNCLNEFMFAEDKAAKDREVAEWFYICGIANRMILPDKKEERDESPFEIYTLDPRYSFVVRYNGLGERVVMGVKYITRIETGERVYSIYTENMYFEVENGVITEKLPHALQTVPIFEYAANNAKLGAFETVLPLLNALNTVASNRLDGIEQFVQALLMLKGVDIESEDFKNLKELGGIKVPVDGDLKYLVQELNQEQTQTIVDYMYQTVLNICGMPNRNGGNSTSDTGAAVIMRDGWSAAEARAKDTELMFKRAEKEFLKTALYITNTVRYTDLKLSEIEIRFTRRNYENILEKSQVLTTMLGNEKIHPQLAFSHCGMFVDPEMAYTKSMEYYESLNKEGDLNAE